MNNSIYYRNGIAAGFLCLLLAFGSAVVRAEETQNAVSGQDPQWVDDISSALENAERMMAEQDTLIQKARRHLSAVEASPLPSDPGSEEVHASSEGLSVAYLDPLDSSSLMEERTEPVHLEPPDENRTYLEQIQKDFETHMANEPGYARRYVPSDGMIAYKVAASDGILTPEEAEEIALTNSVKLQSLAKRIKSSQYKLAEARRAFFPTLSAEVFKSGGFSNSDNFRGASYKLNFSQPLFDGGELLFTLRQQEAVLESDKVKFEKEKGDVIHTAGESYRSYVNAIYNREYQEALLGELESMKQRADRAYDQKLITEIENLEMQSTFQQVLFQRESSLSTLATARLLFFQALGLEEDESLKIDSTLEAAEIPVSLETIRELVRNNNWDVKIKELAAKASYYQVKVNESKKKLKIDLRGYVGSAGESVFFECERDNNCDTAGVEHIPVSLDLDKENAVFVEAKVPFGANTLEYEYNRRIFGPTVSTFGGAPQDWKHRVRFHLLDKLELLSDEEKDIAEYLNAQAELQKELVDQDSKANEAYYDYKGAILQMNTSKAKVKFREKQVEALKVLFGLQESSLTTLLSEMIQLSEDRYSYVKAVSDTQNALSDINRLIGIEDYYGSEYSG